MPDTPQPTGQSLSPFDTANDELTYAGNDETITADYEALE